MVIVIVIIMVVVVMIVTAVGMGVPGDAVVRPGALHRTPT